MGLVSCLVFKTIERFFESLVGSIPTAFRHQQGPAWRTLRQAVPLFAQYSVLT
jgi:hypothetical protein